MISISGLIDPGSAYVPMMLGSIGFAAYGFGMTSLNRRLETRWADMPVAGMLNPIQWTGGDGE